MHRIPAVLTFVACLLAASAAMAQSTGMVSGRVVDGSDRPIAGAVIRVSTDTPPSTQATVTSEHGQFGFVLAAGDYRVEAEKPGLGTAVRLIAVLADRTTQCDFILGPVVSESVAVTMRASEIAMPEVNLTYGRQFFQNLPLDRSYRGLLQLIPGIPENNAFAPNGGGSRQDNTFLTDSVNITNPLFGYLSTEINELDIAEVHVKRGGIGPEFGRLTGFSANVVTRSGSNVVAGHYRFEAIPTEWIAASSRSVRSQTGRQIHAFDLGGPIVKDRLFYYGSGRISRSESARAVNIFGPIPNRTDRTEEYFGKATGHFGSRHILTAGYRHRPTATRFAGIGANDTPSVASHESHLNRVAYVTGDLLFDSQTTLSLRYVHVGEENESRAVTDLGVEPPFIADNLAAMGRFVLGGLTVGGASLALNRQDYARSEARAVLTRLMSVGPAAHQLKAGFAFDRGTEDLTRVSNGWGDISYVLVEDRLRIRGTYYPDQPPQRSTGRTYSLFVQDAITTGSRLTIHAGVLLNRDEFVQADARNTRGGRTTFPVFGFGDEIQPRLGVTVQGRKEREDKIYAHWGRSYGLDQKGTARAVAAGRLFTEDADFDPETGALLARSVSPNTGPKSVAPGLEPPRTDELVVGYATRLTTRWSLDAFVLARRSRSFIEDVPTALPYSDFQFQNDPVASRTYRTFVMEVRGSGQPWWSLTASYAWSRFAGNYDLDYGDPFLLPPATSSFINDGPGAFTDDGFRYGVLSQDRTHCYKILATWTPQWIDDVSAGVFVRGQSGTPWEARGLPWSSSVAYLRLLERAGTHRTPFWVNTDLLMKYSLKIGSRRAVHVEGRILNVFNQETALLVDQRKFLDPRNLTIAGAPPPGCRPCFTDAFVQGVTQPNPRFGEPIAYAQPRRFLLSVLVDF